MSQWSQQSADERFRLLPAPPDPVKIHQKAGHAHFNRTLGRNLMPQSLMPVGEHRQKTMERVPLDYLLWVNAQRWAQDWPDWAPVADYLSRCGPHSPCAAPGGEDGSPSDPPVIFVEPHRKHPTQIKCFKAGSAHLHTLPGHEDKLHAFAEGALGLRRDWYQTGKGKGAMPHYDVTVGKHTLALARGALLITDAQLLTHLQTWRTWFATKPRYQSVSGQ